ncbi:MAG: helix-turn-helix transcriptional regulator [Desulfobacteraceae bacterium]|nr:helix-turn-helix transcriptional regulator [Desulfobacteraceae bacterium]
MKTKQYIKTIRNTLKMTQSEFAEFIGIKHSNLANYETGRATPPGNIILKIQSKIGVDPFFMQHMHKKNSLSI